MTNKYNQTLMTVRYIICALTPMTAWDIVVEDYATDRIGTKVNTNGVYYTDLDKGKVEKAVKEVLNYPVVSVDFMENVIFCTKENVNK